MTESSTLGTVLGWERNGWGYHSDDGIIITNNETICDGQSYGAGDVIGVGVNPVDKTAWFTLEGRLQGEC